MRLAAILALAFTLPGFPSPSARAGEPAVSGWLGDGSGVFAEQAPPTSWDPNTGENILWKTPLPNWCNGSPVAADGRIFLLAEPVEFSPLLLCFDAETGRELWRRELDATAAMTPDLQAEARPLARETWDWNRRMISLWVRMFEFRRNHIDQFDGFEPSEELRPEWEGYIEQVEQLGLEYKGFISGAGGFQTRFHVPRGGYARRRIRRLNDLGLRWSHWCYFGTWDGVAFPTPVTDGRRVWTVTGQNLYSCHDRDGNLLWTRRFAPAKSGHLSDAQRARMTDAKGRVRWPWGWPGQGHFSTSPVLVDGKLLSQAGAWVRCLDAETGGMLWQRPLRGAIGQNIAVPRVLDLNGTQVAIGGGSENRVGRPGDDILRLRDGKRLGVLPGYTSAKMSVAGAVAEGDTIWHYDGDWRDRDLVATRLKLAPGGQAIQREEIWRIKDRSVRRFKLWRTIVRDGRLYHGSTVLDGRSGKLPAERLPAARRRYCWRSGLIVGDAFLSVDHRGGHFVLRDLETGGKLGRGRLPVNPPGGLPAEWKRTQNRASRWSVLGAAMPLPYRDRLYIRAFDYLWCIGRGGGAD